MGSIFVARFAGSQLAKAATRSKRRETLRKISAGSIKIAEYVRVGVSFARQRLIKHIIKLTSRSILTALSPVTPVLIARTSKDFIPTYLSILVSIAAKMIYVVLSLTMCAVTNPLI